MVGSFVVFAIAAILRLIFGTLESEYSWLSKVIPITNWICLGLAAVFVLFTIIGIVRVILAIRRNK